MNNWQATDERHVWHPFTPLMGQPHLMVTKARGMYLHTADGRKILDAISSWWVNIHGHAHPTIAKAIGKQARKLEQVIFAGFTHQPAVSLTSKLLRILPPNQERVFFSDDGSTSVEVAIKLAMQYWYNQGVERRQFIAIEGAYHGDTFGSMSVADRSVFSKPFAPFLFHVDFVPFPEGDGSNTLEALKKLASDQTAAFIFEPLVQGAAGMRMYTPQLLDEMIRVVRGQGGLCITDEVMTGFGRTGKLFASDHLEEKPDLFCLSKGITGGFLPMGVTTVSLEVASAFQHKELDKTFFHGHSYTANPLACAAANASMKLLLNPATQEAIARITERHQTFIAQTKWTAKVKNVRSCGTILAIELDTADAGYTSGMKERIYTYFMERNLLLRPLGNVIYVMPPYVITDRELRRIYKAILEFIDSL